jgi:hypothetical protein
LPETEEMSTSRSSFFLEKGVATSPAFKKA